MTTRKLEGLLAAALTGALALTALPTAAEITAGSQEVQVYAGAVFGDEITDEDVSGETPELDDEFVIGLRYGYDFTEALGVELSAGYSPGSITDVPGRDIDVDVTTVELDGIYHFNPAGRLVPYVVGGVGYAWADLDDPIVGEVNGASVAIGDDSGYTLNAGGGAKYFLTENVVVRLDARYRYMDAVVEDFDGSLDTVEATLGIGWKF